MKKTPLLLSILCFLLPAALLAQPTWHMVHPQFPANLYDIHFVDANTGFAAGENGFILKTTDGGNTWNPTTTNASGTIRTVHFANAQNGIAGGDFGVAMYTTDGGNTWTPSTISQYNILSMAMGDQNTGIAVTNGGTIIRTGNGGASWNVVDLVPGFVELNGVTFVDNSTAYIVGEDGTIRKSTNSGTSWGLGGNTGNSNEFSGVHFMSLASGVICGQSIYYYNGSVWTKSSFTVTQYLNAVHFPDGVTGYIAGNNGTILKSTDGGVTWAAQTSGTTRDLYSVWFTSTLKGFAVGESGVILKTTDGGDNWTVIKESVNADMRGIFNASDKKWFAGGSNGTIIKTEDYGHTWSLSNSGIKTYHHVTDIVFASPTEAYASTATDPPFATGDIYWSVDGGATWTEYGFSNMPPVSSLVFPTVNRGYGVAGSRIIRTTNGGVSWSFVYTNGSIDLYDIHFVDSMTGYVCGEFGSILKTDDGGSTWFVREDPTMNDDLYCIWFISDNVGLAGGQGGRLMRTVNGGIDWTIFNTSSIPYDFNDIYFVNGQEGFLTGNAGMMLRSTNGGANFTTQLSTTTENIHRLKFHSTGMGFAVADNSIVLKYAQTGGVGVPEPGFEISATGMSVYPNPASDVINLSLAGIENSNSASTVTVSDINGKTISQHKLDGNKLSVPVSTLQPGIYIVQVIHAEGTFSQKFIKN